MIPQLIVASWITLVFVYTGFGIYKLSRPYANNMSDAIALGIFMSVAWVLIPIISLNVAGFWGN